MKLYGALLSPYVRKVVVVLNLKGLEFEHINVMPGSLPDNYLTLSPLGKIPAFEDGELKLADSSVICEYLEEQYPSIAALPNTPAQRARSRWLEEYADSKLVELFGSGIFFERVIKPLMLQQDTDTEKVSKTINEMLPPVLDYVESQLPEKGFLFNNFTIADIAVASPIINAGYADYTVDSARWPKVSAFVDSVKAHRAVSKALRAETALMASFTT